MKGLDWCHLYNTYHDRTYNSSVMGAEVKRLHEDDEVQKTKGIYEFFALPGYRPVCRQVA